MPTPDGDLRLLHTSDWHLGRTLFQESLLDAQQAFLAWLLDLAHAERVDAVLVAGDVYDRAVPGLDAVRVLDDALLAFAAAGIPLVAISGNHDSAVRLGFGRGLAAHAGIHLRTGLPDITAPLVLTDRHGPVGVYGIPYLLPDAVMADLGAERSHASVLRAATDRVLADAAERGIGRTVVLGHAFVTGGQVSDSERDVRVGGIGDAPAHVFEGVTYAALGHLHRPQEVTLDGSDTHVRYSGSPLAFSFSEKDDGKSVTLVDLDAAGVAAVTQVPAPVPRRLREVRGRLDDLLTSTHPDHEDLADCWVKVVLTDPSRPSSPMERLRRRWPHTLTLDFQPDGQAVAEAADLERLRRQTDPVLVCGMFVEYVDRVAATGPERVVLRDAVESARGDQGGRR